MPVSKIAGFAIATFLVVHPAAFAQTGEPQSSTQPAAQAQTKNADQAAVQTFTGCLMTEPDYRKAHNLGSGALGGVGLGDEFVLTDVTTSPAMGAAAAPRATDAPATTATPSATPCPDKGTAYRLTGTQEEKIKGLVGHQIEVTGRFKHADDAAAGGTRPGEKLPAEVEIVSFREAPAPAAMAEPAAPVTPRPTPPATVEPRPQPQPPAAAPTTPTPPERHELPHTAGSTTLFALVGALALGAALGMTLLRRRAL